MLDPRHALFLALLSSLCVAPVHPQTALLREGDALVGGPPGHVITALHVPVVNSTGGYGVTLSSTNGSASKDQVWGSPVGGIATPEVFLTRTTVGSLAQTSWDTLSCGLGNGGEFAYKASGTGGPVGDFMSIWRDLTPIMVEGDPIPGLPGKFWRSANRPRAIDDGSVVFVGSITASPGGPSERGGLFRDGQPIHLGGDVLPGLPLPVQTASAAFSSDFHWSRSGNHYLVEVRLDSGSQADDGALVLDGEGLLVGGILAREGDPVPTSVGGLPGERWDNFDSVAVTDHGHYMFTGDTDGGNQTDEFIVVNGDMVYREGDVLGSGFLSGFVKGATLNPAGKLAFFWGVDVAGTVLDVLVVDGKLVMQEGDEVDFDGDGIPDPGFTLFNLVGGTQMTYTADETVYFIADVKDANHTLREVLYIYRAGVGTPYCASSPNSVSAAGSRISAQGSSSLADENLTLIAFHAPDEPGLFYFGPDPISQPFGNGLRCVGGNVVRLPVVWGADGSFQQVLDFSDHGNTLASLGKVYFQCWYRDPGGGGAAFNLSNGLEVVFTP